jgi:hypothetical protein
MHEIMPKNPLETRIAEFVFTSLMWPIIVHYDVKVEVQLASPAVCEFK